MSRSISDYEDALDWARDREWYMDMCRCGGDMPGLCFGPQNCPMCKNDDGDQEIDDLIEQELSPTTVAAAESCNE